jgi:glucose-6-phosphate-specific signal transduction histidine kinase
VLPEIHSILLSIDSMELNSLKTTLVDLHKKVSSILIQIPSEHFQKEKSSLLDALMKLSKSEFSEDEMEWRIENNLDAKINSLNERSQELIYFAVKEVFRNIIKYAKIKDKKLFIIIEMKSNLEYLYISIQDNGGKIDLINNKSGAGQGLAIHSALLATIGGNLQRDTIAGKSSTVRIKVPF